MRVIRGVVGVLLILMGLVFIGQGLNLILGSPVMSGHPIYAALGLLCVLVGAWLFNGAARPRIRGSRPG